MTYNVFLAVVAAICFAMLARLLLPRAWRDRLDLEAQRAWWRIKGAFARLRRRRRPRPVRTTEADAEREAREAIERAARRKRTLH